MLQHLHTQIRAYLGRTVGSLSRSMPAWVVSFTIHVLLLVLVSLLSFAVPLPFQLTLQVPNVVPLEAPIDQFQFQDAPSEEVGAASEDGLGVAMAAAPELEMLEDIEQQPELELLDEGDIQFVDDVELVTTPLNTSTKLVRGVAGVGVTGANGAIDRLTSEILLSIEDKDTLVVWLFDQSASLSNQREEINHRLAHIYDELGIIQERTLPATSNRHPLLTAVMAFGENASWMIEQPTADAMEIQKAVATISLDQSGVENVFAAVHRAANDLKKWRSKRNVMLILVTDEVGDDHNSMLEPTIKLCRKNAMPVYVLGVPAAFGRSETLLKWVDPNPKYDQSVRWGRVNQGPESLRRELLQLPFGNAPSEAMDSGFGPYALTRLCYQTGGIYFTIHPNRRLGGRVGKGETDNYTSHMAYFFDPQRIRPYRPDYISLDEYRRRAKDNLARAALLTAAQMTINRLDQPATRFVKRDEAQFANALTDAQKDAAKLEPKLNSLFEVLRRGEEDRAREDTLRWQAAYDLAYGQTLAVLVRTRAYNEMLATGKRGLTPEDPKNNTWRLVPSNELTTSSRLEKYATRAKQYLNQVVDEHSGTPWALIANRELEKPMGWTWKESFTPQPQPNMQANNGNNNNPRRRDDKVRMLPKGPPKRDVPKL